MLMYLLIPNACMPPAIYIEHSIDLMEGAQPIQKRPYRVSHGLNNEIKKIIEDLLEYGFINPSSNPFASPVLLVNKKDSSWRMCMDYRKLNDITIKDKFPMSVIEDLLSQVHGA